jgi:hypothetical protein
VPPAVRLASSADPGTVPGFHAVGSVHAPSTEFFHWIAVMMILLI